MKNILFGAIKKKAVTVMQGIANILATSNITLLDGPNAKTDTKGTVWAPVIPDDASVAQQVKYLTNVAHEVAHNRHGSDVRKMGGNTNPLRHKVINFADDIRIESLQEREYHGLKKYYQMDYEFLLEDKRDVVEKQTAQSATELLHKALWYMIVKCRCETLDIDHKLIPEQKLGEFYDTYLADLEPEAQAQQTFEDSITLGEKVLERVKKFLEDEARKEAKQKQEQQKKEKQEQEKQEQQKKEKQEQSEENESGDDESKDDDSEGDDSEGEDSEGEDSEGEDSEGDESEGDDSEGDDSKGGDSKGGESEGDESEDESDDKSKGGQSSDDESEDEGPSDKEIEQAVNEKLKELEQHADELETPKDEDAKEIKALQDTTDEYMVAPHVKDNIDEMASYAGSYTKTILDEGLKILGASGARMMQAFVTSHRPRELHNRREGRLDMRSLVSDHLDTKKDVFSVRLPGAQDWAAVYFVLDQSSSMENNNKHITAIQVLAAMMHYLDRAGVPVEAIGFSSDDENATTPMREFPMNIHIIKRFSEPFRGVGLNRCWARREGYTPSLDALKYAVPRLMARPEERKILFVLCDGKPYVGKGSLTKKLEASEKRYIKAIKKAGVQVCGLGIEEDLSAYYGDSFVYVDTSTLGSVMVEKMLKVLNSRQG